MNTTDDARKHPRQDADLIRSNPVYVAERLLTDLAPWFHQDRLMGTVEGPARFSRCLEELARLGGRSPDVVVERYRRANCVPPGFRLTLPDVRPGVLGLAVDPSTQAAFVVPLRPERLLFGGVWDVDRSLPFPEDDVRDLLVALMCAGVPDARGVPERLAYRFENPLRQRVRGNSMTLAAVFAILDELGRREDERLRAVVALVEPGVDGALEEVEEIPAKLNAAFREHERLSLVVVREGSTALKALDPARVENIWEVRTVGMLAVKLAATGLLAPLIQAGTAPLGQAELVRVQNRLEWLMNHEHKYSEAADLADRVRLCEKQSPIDPGTLTEIGRLSAAACRHHGRFIQAVELSREIHAEVSKLGPSASDDEEADAAAEYAAALFDCHEFRKIPPLLESWATKANEDKRRFRVLTRIKVWNTLARARVIIGSTGWEDLFRSSLELNRDLNDTVNIQRSSSYLVHGLLRHGRVGEAVLELNAEGSTRVPLPPVNPWIGFAIADAARVEGVEWGHPELDRANPDDEHALQKHAHGCYFQATGRQTVRVLSGDLGRLDRLSRAARFFRAEGGGAHQNICSLFAVALDLAIAGLTLDVSRWADAVNKIRAFLNHPDAAGLRKYYAECVDAIPLAPDAEVAEQLLRTIPYF